MHSYIPRLHDSPLPAQDQSGAPASGWFGPSIPAPDPQNEVCQITGSSACDADSVAAQAAYGPFSYDHSYVTPHTASGPFSPHPPFSHATDVPGTAPANVENVAGTFSPVSQYSKTSEVPQPEFVRHSEEPYAEPKPATEAPGSHLQSDSNTPNRPRSSPSTFVPNQQTAGPVEYPWTMNPLGISTPGMHEHYYSSPTYPPLRDRSPRFSEPAMDLHGDMIAPQPRRMYAPIAPHPSGPRTSAPKRSRDDDEDPSEHAKRRKRSDSNTNMTIELGEEDRLLIKLKDEESMPWKDIAARFQSDLGKTYQIPALQMRLKRLRERMRVWTEADVKALRMAHEYWVQSKFDIISQKVCSILGTPRAYANPYRC